MSNFYYNYLSISYLPRGILSGKVRLVEGKLYLLDWQVVPRYPSQKDTLVSKTNGRKKIKGFVDKEKKIMYVNNITNIW